MNLNDLFRAKEFEPEQILVLRHRPHEPGLRKVLPWIAGERPDVFNAYQQTQGEKLEKVMEAMKSNGYIASFIGHEQGKAVLVGLYSLSNSKPITNMPYWQIPASALL